MAAVETRALLVFCEIAPVVSIERIAGSTMTRQSGLLSLSRLRVVLSPRSPLDLIVDATLLPRTLFYVLSRVFVRVPFSIDCGGRDGQVRCVITGR